MLGQLPHVIFQRLDQLRELWFLSDCEAFLDDIVSELIIEQVEVLGFVPDQAIDELSVGIFGVVIQTLLNHVAAELLLRQRHQITD